MLQMEDSKCKFRSRVANLILRFTLFCLYVILGMVIIVAIEQKEHHQRKSKLFSDLQLNITTKYNISKQEFESLANAIYSAKSPSPLKWSYGQGFSFTIQLLTTIGKLQSRINLLQCNIKKCTHFTAYHRDYGHLMDVKMVFTLVLQKSQESKEEILFSEFKNFSLFRNII